MGIGGAQSSEEFWRTYSAYTSGYQSVDRLSDIDEFEESFKYLSVVDKTKHYYTLCRLSSDDTIHGVDSFESVQVVLSRHIS